MLVFALTRWPGLLPQNFSAVYALVFCAGLYFRGGNQWLLPAVTMLLCDGALTWYYQARNPEYNLLSGVSLLYMAANYAAYAALFALGRRFSPKARIRSLLGGGILGALLFYLVTNTAAWLFNPFRNPEYTKDLVGWFIALTKGTAGYAQTWEFFRNTLLSGGLFTGLFAGAMKLTEAAESAREKEAPDTQPETPPDGDAKPEEAKA